MPKKIGVEANAKNMNDLKLQKANQEKVAQENLDAAKAFAKDLETKEIVLTMKAGEGGRVFGSVSTKEIAEAVKAQVSANAARLAELEVLEKEPSIKDKEQTKK